MDEQVVVSVRPFCKVVQVALIRGRFWYRWFLEFHIWIEILVWSFPVCCVSEITSDLEPSKSWSLRDFGRFSGLHKWVDRVKYPASKRTMVFSPDKVQSQGVLDSRAKSQRFSKSRVGIILLASCFGNRFRIKSESFLDLIDNLQRITDNLILLYDFVRSIFMRYYVTLFHLQTYNKGYSP